MEPRKALGRGLSSLIPNVSKISGNNKDYFECETRNLVARKEQPRKLFNNRALEELALSIEEKGILQPLVVRALKGGKYEIIAGERRFRAAQKAGLAKVPVTLKVLDDREASEIALMENLQREDLNPVEQANAYRDLIEKYQYTQEELSRRLGKDRSVISNSLRLLKLAPALREYLISGKLTTGHARALLGLEDHQTQTDVANAILENDLSVRKTEEWIRQLKNQRLESPKPKASQKMQKQTFAMLQERLIEKLRTKVQIAGNNKKGRLVLHFHSEEELDRLAHLLMDSTSTDS